MRPWPVFTGLPGPAVATPAGCGSAFLSELNALDTPAGAARRAAGQLLLWRSKSRARQVTRKAAKDGHSAALLNLMMSQGVVKYRPASRIWKQGTVNAGNKVSDTMNACIG